MAMRAVSSACKVWVGNLPRELEVPELELHLLEHFSQVGAPKQVCITQPGCGCVAYDSADEAQAAIEAFNGTGFLGQILETSVWTETKGKGGNASCQGGKLGMFGKGAQAASPQDSLDARVMNQFARGASPLAKGALAQGKGGPVFQGKGKKPPPVPLLQQYAASAGQGAAGGGGGGSWISKKHQKMQGNLPKLIRLSVPLESDLVMQGMPETAPGIFHEKGIELFSQASMILQEIVGDVKGLVQIEDDSEGKLFPEIRDGIRQHEEVGNWNAGAIAICQQAGKWAVGMAAGWKNRQPAAKLALAVAIAAENPAMCEHLANNYRGFAGLLQLAGVSRGSPGMSTVDSSIPPVHMLSTDVFASEGLPAEAPAIQYSKQLKEYFSNAHSILSEFVTDPSTCDFRDDAEGKLMPAVAAAIKAVAPEEDPCFCVAVSPCKTAWGVGLGYGWKTRLPAAKMALGLAMSQAKGQTAALAKRYEELGRMLAAAGWVETST